MVEPSFLVSHSRGEYPVYIGAGILQRIAELLTPHLSSYPALTITDSNVERELGRWIAGGGHPWGPAPAEDAAWRSPLTFPAGESHKTRATWARLTDMLLERAARRDMVVLAVGGGVVGDVAGFVAATYLRGIRYVQVPTSLLAMVDASVGGKVAVDTDEGKNLVGAFHPPVAVVADIHTLETLPQRDFRAGFAEAVKHGLIADRGHFEWIEANVEPLLEREPTCLMDLVRSSVAIKSKVVGQDEREAGARMMLNAGHTVAHALELLSGYELLHGEAVAIGLVAESRIGERLGITAPGTAGRLAALFGRFGLPVGLDGPLAARVREEGLAQAIRHDKKRRDDEIRLALVERVGAMASSEGRPVMAVSEQDVVEGVLRAD